MAATLSAIIIDLIEWIDRYPLPAPRRVAQAGVGRAEETSQHPLCGSL